MVHLRWNLRWRSNTSLWHLFEGGVDLGGCPAWLIVSRWHVKAYVDEVKGSQVGGVYLGEKPIPLGELPHPGFHYVPGQDYTGEVWDPTLRPVISEIRKAFTGKISLTSKKEACIQLTTPSGTMDLGKWSSDAPALAVVRALERDRGGDVFFLLS